MEKIVVALMVEKSVAVWVANWGYERAALLVVHLVAERDLCWVASLVLEMVAEMVVYWVVTWVE